MVGVDALVFRAGKCRHAGEAVDQRIEVEDRFDHPQQERVCREHWIEQWAGELDRHLHASIADFQVRRQAVEVEASELASIFIVDRSDQRRIEQPVDGKITALGKARGEILHVYSNSTIT